MRLPRSFYNRPALVVAKELLGKTLVLSESGKRRAGIIVETEAYVGEHDLACHAAKGRTKRTEVLFGPPGHAYVYLIYGMYDCFNVVTEPEGVAAAVLIRGLEPLEGIDPALETNGPGKLCRAMEITRQHNRLDLCGEVLWLEDGRVVKPSQIAKGARIGVDYAGEWAHKHYRFWIDGNAHVSKVPKKKVSFHKAPRRS
ncbi:MAG: DNA-3-methyladenine glycosylase [Myxococcaceae bacterium]